MVEVSIAEIHAKKMLGKEVRIKGWVFRRRKSGKILFLQIRESGAILQCTIEENIIGPEAFEEARKISIESSVEIIGILREEPRSPGGIELSVNKLKLSD